MSPLAMTQAYSKSWTLPPAVSSQITIAMVVGCWYTGHASPASGPLELSRPPTASAEAHLRMAATDKQTIDRRISVVGLGQTLPAPAAGLSSYTSSSAAAKSTSKPGLTRTSIFDRSGLHGKGRRALAKRVSLRDLCLAALLLLYPLLFPLETHYLAPNRLYRLCSAHNTRSASGTGHVGKSSQCLMRLEV